MKVTLTKLGGDRGYHPNGSSENDLKGNVLGVPFVTSSEGASRRQPISEHGSRIGEGGEGQGGEDGKSEGTHCRL